METWMFSNFPMKPQSGDSGSPKSVYGQGGNAPRGELGAIRAVNGDDRDSTHGVFDGNVPPTSRSDGPQAKDFMTRHWKSWLSQSHDISNKTVDGWEIGKTESSMFSIIDEHCTSMNILRIPLGYWLFSDWKNPKERGILEKSDKSSNEPEVWYNNEGFVVGGKKYLEALLQYIKNSPKLKHIRVILDLHALPGVHTACSDFAGWNTGAFSGNPQHGIFFAGGTWFTDFKSFPIQNDKQRANGKVNWVYPGPLPGAPGVTAYSGFDNWIEHSIQIFTRMCEFAEKHSDVVYAVECVN